MNLTTIVEKIKKIISFELSKASWIRIVQLSIIFLLAVPVLRSVIWVTQGQHTLASAFDEQVGFFVATYILGLFFGITLWITLKSLKKYNVSPKDVLYGILFSWCGLITLNVFFLDALGLLGKILYVGVSFTIFFTLVSLSLIPLAGISFFLVLKRLAGKDTKVFVVWAGWQGVQIILAIVLLFLFAWFQANKPDVMTLYTSDVVPNEFGSLVTLNRTEEGHYSEYCTVQLGKEWRLLEHDPVRDRVRLPDSEWDIFSNQTRRFTNNQGNVLSFHGLFSVGGDYRHCSPDLQAVRADQHVICYSKANNGSNWDIEGHITHSKNKEIGFTYNSSSSQEPNFIEIFKTVSCSSDYLSDSWLDRLFLW